MASKDNQQKKKYPPLILELSDRRQSMFIMEGTTNDRLDTSSEFLLLPRSVMEKDGKRIPIRYIFQSDEFITENQDKRGIKPNPKMDIIVFNFGRLTVERTGANIGLYDFLSNHEGNRDAQHRPANAADTFYQINTEVQAEKEMENLDFMTSAMEIISQLRRKEGNEYEYEEARIEHICKLLNVVSLDTPAENLRVLVNVALSNPEFFVGVIDEANANMRVEIITAKELGVLSTEGPAASWISDGKIFYKFRDQKNAEKRMLELAMYLNSKEGGNDYTILKTKVELVKKAQLETQ